jgi:hypothetical protein
VENTMFTDFTVGICARIENDEHKAQLKKCIESIKTHIGVNESTQIVIVDSDSPDKSYMDEYEHDDRIFIENIANKHYEAGAWFHIYKNYISKRYLFMQDSCFLVDKVAYLESSIVSLMYPHNSWDFSTGYEIQWVKDSFTKTKWGQVIEPFTMMVGSVFYCQRVVLDDLYANGVFNSFPTCKSESQAYERYIGAALTAAGYQKYLLETPRLPISKRYFSRQ